MYFGYVYPQLKGDLFSRTDGEEQTRISLNCTEKALMQVVAQLSQNRQLYQRTEILSLEKVKANKVIFTLNKKLHF